MKKWPQFASLYLLLTGVVTVSAQTSVTPLDELAFGTVAAVNGGTVTIGADGSRSVQGLIDVAAAPGGGVATFDVQGTPSTVYSLSLPSSITLHRSTGTETMTIDDFVTDPDGFGLLDGTGHQLISIGATLHVGAAQRPGTYSGSFDITLDYQ
jgi:hypothetical protein